MQIFKDIFTEILKKDSWNSDSLQKILRKYPKDGRGLYRHDELVEAYNKLVESKEIDENHIIEKRVRLKPIRTMSGVAVVTVLMKPFPCPGDCIFCPNIPNMPKSYIPSEPGAQRALKYNFDPFDQTKYRIEALKNIGHSTDKIELIILGGTCSVYPENYQIWFIKRCFDAMNSFDKNFSIKNIAQEDITWEVLYKVQEFNEKASCRNVGLVLETRPDYIDEKEIVRLRKLGATKIQIGVQSLNEKVLKKNKRGHGVGRTINAFKLLRMAGFKIHAHIMPNLHKSNLRNDINDYKKLWKKEFSPDELKIYPTSIIPNTELEEIYKKGNYKPYTYKELIKYFKETLPLTPRFVRITRVVRDIPADEIVAGNTFSNFRQIAEEEISRGKKRVEDIRSREIRNSKITLDDIEEEIIRYTSLVSEEFFISYKTKKDDRICGFLRLTIPKENISKDHFIEELRNCSIIREIHVYGNVVDIGRSSKGSAQHLGLGKKLITIAEDISREKEFKKISVISAIGTREYYKARDFKTKGLYMIKEI